MMRALMIHVVLVSANLKLGSITATRTRSTICPSTCGLLSTGECYDLQGNTRIHRDNVDRRDPRYKSKMYTLSSFLDAMAGFTRIWRWAVGGDLPNHMRDRNKIDAHFVAALTARAQELSQSMIAFTHKPVRAGVRGATKEQAHHNRQALRKALKAAPDVTINISAESEKEAEQAFKMGFDVAMTGPIDAPNASKTKGGVPLIKCHAVRYDHVTCQSCGGGQPLCSRRDRGFIVVFPAHGTKKGALSDRIIQSNLAA